MKKQISSETLFLLVNFYFFYTIVEFAKLHEVGKDYSQQNDIHSIRLKAGKRRTYFFDVRTTRSNDYFITITESKKLPNDEYERHKLFLYKEDFVKFLGALQESIDQVKALLPDFDFDNPIKFDGEFPETPDEDNETEQTI